VKKSFKMKNFEKFNFVCFIRYANLTAMSTDLTSILGTVTEQVSVLLKSPPTKSEHVRKSKAKHHLNSCNKCKSFQTIESYSTELKHLIEKSKHQVVILIDSVDKIFDIKDIDWLPLELVNNVKIILTVSETESSPVLKALQNKINAQNFLLLSSFTQEQWEDVLTFGGGTNNGALQLPESWKKSEERAPIQAKVS
jgi:AAA+ ATPase superfamily predicted ATPase